MDEGCELAVGAREIVEVGHSNLCGLVVLVGGCGGENRLGGSGLVDCMCSCGCLGWRDGGFDSNRVVVVWGLGEDWMGLLAGVWLTGLGLVGLLMDRLLELVLWRLLFSSVVIGSVSNSCPCLCSVCRPVLVQKCLVGGVRLYWLWDSTQMGLC